MKKLLSILFALQIALLVLFTAPSSAQAQWGEDSYRGRDSYRQDWKQYRGNDKNNWDRNAWDRNDWDQRNNMTIWGYHTPPFLWQLGHMDNRSLAFASLYKLAVDIVLSILFIMFFSKLIMKVFNRMSEHPIKNGFVGFTFLVIFPLICIVLLGLLWLGVAGFLTYGLIFLMGLFLAKVFIGWAILRKLEKGYVLDWKAGLAGPLVVFILLFIPVLGWIAIAVILSVTTGSFLKELLPLLERQKVENKATKK